MSLDAIRRLPDRRPSLAAAIAGLLLVVAAAAGPAQAGGSGTIPDAPDAPDAPDTPATRADAIAAAIVRHETAAARAAGTGRPADALDHWAAIARLDPSRADAWQRLREDAASPPPLDSASLRDARGALPRGFREERTPHFVILTDTDAAWSLEVGRRLERTYRDFEGFTRRTALETTPLRHRLVCIVFDRKRDFERFGRASDGVAVSWAHGYYSPRRDRVVLYNPASAGDRFAEARALAALMHETTHQLSFHRMVQDTTVQYPLWLNEGLATSFEAAAEDRAAGPWEAFGPRERRLARLVADDRLMPLREFVGLVSLGRADAERIELVYGQCYGLFTWLVTTRPTAVRAFMEAMHREPPGAMRADRLVRLFETHVGSVSAIEAAWTAHLSGRVRRHASADGDRRRSAPAPGPASASASDPAAEGSLILATDSVDSDTEAAPSTEG